MKIIKTNSYIKLSYGIPRGPDYSEGPTPRWTKDDKGPASTIFDENDDSVSKIKKKWKKKQPHETGVIYQIGVPVPK